MIANKHLPKLIALLICACLLFCGFIVYAANAFDTTRVTEYQKRIFNGEIASLEIIADVSDWQDLMSNAQAKEWIRADIVINGERFQSVGVRAKGNSSIMPGARGGSDGGRYSLQISMDKYIKGQTYYGLDTFAVNNQVYDTTRMKDYIAYDIMDFIGVPSPLTNFAEVTVNGEDYGFMLMLERYDQAFLDRVYGTSAGQLYSVKIEMGRRGDFEDMWQDVSADMPGRGQGGGRGFGGIQQDGGRGFGGGMDAMQQGGGRGMGGGMGGFGGMGGGSLVYTDDDVNSYSSIFNNSIGKPSEQSERNVITAIENLNAGTDLDKYWDVDGTLRYLAAHTVVVNLDSYTSNMAQNYYIYERNGRLTILPWDYDLSFGGFMSGNASSTINFPISTPVSGVSIEDRPLINKLLEVDEYRQRYYGYLREIVEGYFESGLFEAAVVEMDARINEYVKNDATAASTHAQYEASLPVFIEVGSLRAESIRGQLDGVIPSTSSGQNADGTMLIDASSVNLSALGTMAGGFGGIRMGIPGEQGGGFGGGAIADMGLMLQAIEILQEAGGELTEEAKDALEELGIPSEQIEIFGYLQPGLPGQGMGRGFPGGGQPGGILIGQQPGGFPEGMQPRGFSDGANMEGRGNPPDGNPNAPQAMSRPNSNDISGEVPQNGIDTVYVITIVVLMLVLVVAIIIIARPNKNRI